MTRARRLLIATAGWSAVVCFGVCAEPPAGSSANSPGTRDVVAGTQRELEELSALQRGLTGARTDAPLLALPDLEAPAPVETKPAAPLSPEARQQVAEELRRQRESRNWLLEAMRKPAPGKPGDSSQAREKALAKLLSGDGSGSTAGNGKPTLDVVSEALRAEKEATALEAPVRTDTIKADNPLDAFLSAWMTPGDFALLGNSRGSGDNGATVGEVRIDRVLAGTSKAAEPAAAARNPYLLDLPAFNDLPASRAPAGDSGFTTSAAASTGPVVLTPSAAGPFGTSAVGGDPKSRPVETRFQPPPSVDEKYFPQLKRF